MTAADFFQLIQYKKKKGMKTDNRGNMKAHSHGTELIGMRTEESVASTLYQVSILYSLKNIASVERRARERYSAWAMYKCHLLHPRHFDDRKRLYMHMWWPNSSVERFNWDSSTEFNLEMNHLSIPTAQNLVPLYDQAGSFRANLHLSGSVRQTEHWHPV